MQWSFAKTAEQFAQKSSLSTNFLAANLSEAIDYIIENER